MWSFCPNEDTAIVSPYLSSFAIKWLSFDNVNPATHLTLYFAYCCTVFSSNRPRNSSSGPPFDMFELPCWHAVSRNQPCWVFLRWHSCFGEGLKQLNVILTAWTRCAIHVDQVEHAHYVLRIYGRTFLMQSPTPDSSWVVPSLKKMDNSPPAKFFLLSWPRTANDAETVRRIFTVNSRAC